MRRIPFPDEARIHPAPSVRMSHTGSVCSADRLSNVNKPPILRAQSKARTIRVAVMGGDLFAYSYRSECAKRDVPSFAEKLAVVITVMLHVKSVGMTRHTRG